MEQNSDAVFEVDQNGKFVSINDIATDITGYSKEELIGTFERLVNDGKLIESKQYFQNTLQGHSMEYETSIYHNDGHSTQLFVNNIPIIVDEVLVGVYGIAKDITEEKILQNEIREKMKKSMHFGQIQLFLYFVPIYMVK
ncbi:hypothetical protein GCM10008025_14640 [Ornithinibacillus halotolerans]|uniref:PAS domain S-box protein n=1 Tax=Ornithinibacillus halotolerans TaxID=1274357 RepID=A0A916RVZ2_9BACI|nr:hypothetical protein GCM10008025_14640 [Ornithinibacillus halotolerans]